VTVANKPKRLEAAEFDRAEAAVAWEDAANTAAETGRVSDRIEADGRERRLLAAEDTIKQVEAEPGTAATPKREKGRRP
jgi:hypothetical protein